MVGECASNDGEDGAPVFSDGGELGPDVGERGTETGSLLDLAPPSFVPRHGPAAPPRIHRGSLSRHGL